MILIDTSAWVEFDRATGSQTDERLTDVIAKGQAFASTEPVEMELLAGASDEGDVERLRRMIRSGVWLATYRSDFEGAAAIYRACRVGGFTPRNMIDCLIATVAMRNGVPVLAVDRDFVGIASVVPLRLDS